MAIKMILLWNICPPHPYFCIRSEKMRSRAWRDRGKRLEREVKGERERISHHASIDSYFDFYFTIQKTADMIWEFIYGIFFFPFPHIMHDVIKIWYFFVFWVFTCFLSTEKGAEKFAVFFLNEGGRKLSRKNRWNEKSFLSCVVFFSSSFHF